MLIGCKTNSINSTPTICIDDAAQVIAEKISEAALAADGDSNLLACLTPTADLATLALQKRSFRTELISRVKKRLYHLKEQITLAPSWLNSPEAQNLASSLNQTLLAPSPSQRDVQMNFMRYLGVKTLSAELVIKGAERVPISPKGCAEVKQGRDLPRRSIILGGSIRRSG